jgi:hypothetical protein
MTSVGSNTQLVTSQPTSIAQVLREIEAARAREAVLDSELASLLKTRQSLATQIGTLYNATDDVAVIHDTTQRMVMSACNALLCYACVALTDDLLFREQAAKIHQSSVSATALSSKVKELDTAQSRLRDALV